MGHNTPFDPDFDDLRVKIERLQRIVDELAAPTSGQIHDQLAKLTTLVNDLATAIENVSQSGATWKGPVDTTGVVKADGGVRSLDVYNRNLSGAGGWKAQYIDISGNMGYVPSSVQFKQDVAPAEVDPDAVLGIQVVQYRYKEAVENFGDDAAVEVGVIAEQVLDQGLPWLLDYEVSEDGDLLPLGFKYERLTVALLAAMQGMDARIKTLEAALDPS